jgi:hypothetical protein
MREEYCVEPSPTQFLASQTVHSPRRTTVHKRLSQSWFAKATSLALAPTPTRRVRGKHKTLEEAVLQNQWPTLAKARGKIVFLMDQRPVGPVYIEGHESLRDRVILPSGPSTP